MHRITLLLAIFLLIPDVYIYLVHIRKDSKYPNTTFLLDAHSAIISHLCLLHVSEW